jgi:YD repeat-containing protein
LRPAGEISVNYRQILVAAHSLPVAFAFAWSDCRAVDMLYLQGQVPTAQKAITAYGTELFGDTVNLYDGSLSIQHTDLNLLGNNELPVSLTRTISPGKSERWTALNRPLGDWAWALPRIGGTFATNTGWRGQDGNVGTRCSQFAPPPEEIISGPSAMDVETPPPGPGVVLSDHQHSVELPGGGKAGPAPMATTYFVPADSFWHGMFLEVPGQGAQEVLKRRTQPHPGYERAPAGGPFPLVTKDNWAIGCLATIKNGAGQGFYAISPSGVRYDFDWLVTRATDPVKFTRTTLQRQDIHLYASKVTDRFGNWVQYSFNASNPALLTKITSSENPSRTITVDYTNGRASLASDGTRSVSYIYNGSTLHKVTVPGNRQWVFNLGPLIPELLGWNSEPVACGDASDGQRPVIPGPGTITHPSGALLTLSTQFVLHAKSAVPYYCYLVDGSYRRTYPPNYLNAAVTAKTITGPGLPAMNWGFGYSDAPEAGDPPEVFRRIVTVAEPDGSSTRHFFGNRWQNNEGQLLKVQKGWSGGQAALKTTHHEYRELTPFGTTILGDKGDYLGSRNVPLSRLATDQQDREFIWAVADPSGFDEFARPVKVSKSGPGGSRIEVTAYEDKLDIWALGQVKTLKQVDVAGTVLHTMAEHEYNAKGQPLTHKAFGVTQSTQTWNTDGTLATKRPGSSAHTTTYSNYKRGIAQNVSYPTGASESAVVDNLGRLTSFTSAAAFTTSFGYDTAGHLNRITPPTGFTATTLLFEPATATAYGLPIGHWRQTISKGSARTITYFDAFWRPVMTRSYDATTATTEAATRKVVVKRYAAGGELSFESYPQRDIASVATSTPGKRMWHDALDRPTRLEADSELSPSVLATDTQYLSDFKIRTTDPKGHISEQTLWALDKPEEAKISAITAALGLTEEVTTSIQRDVFGKPTSISRGGVTRSYVYDAGQRLCKTIEPEVGATIQTYDGAGHIDWRAPGQTFTGTSSCDDASVTSTSKIVFGYDGLGQLLTTTYGDNSPAVTRTYWPDGPLKSVATAAISGTPATSWSYAYNGLRQLTQESLVFDGKTYSFVRGYNASGDATTLSYPTTVTGSPSLAYTPNALGEPSQVGSYASSLKFHPNGAVAEFKYGNTLQHSLSQKTGNCPSARPTARCSRTFTPTTGTATSPASPTSSWRSSHAA